MLIVLFTDAAGALALSFAACGCTLGVPPQADNVKMEIMQNSINIILAVVRTVIDCPLFFLFLNYYLLIGPGVTPSGIGHL
jgi:hypothetical protein